MFFVIFNCNRWQNGGKSESAHCTATSEPGVRLGKMFAYCNYTVHCAGIQTNAMHYVLTTWQTDRMCVGFQPMWSVRMCGILISALFVGIVFRSAAARLNALRCACVRLSNPNIYRFEKVDLQTQHHPFEHQTMRNAHTLTRCEERVDVCFAIGCISGQCHRLSGRAGWIIVNCANIARPYLKLHVVKPIFPIGLYRQLPPACVRASMMVATNACVRATIEMETHRNRARMEKSTRFTHCIMHTVRFSPSATNWWCMQMCSTFTLSSSNFYICRLIADRVATVKGILYVNLSCPNRTLHI